MEISAEEFAALFTPRPAAVSAASMDQAAAVFDRVHRDY